MLLNSSKNMGYQVEQCVTGQAAHGKRGHDYKDAGSILGRELYNGRPGDILEARSYEKHDHGDLEKITTIRLTN